MILVIMAVAVVSGVAVRCPRTGPVVLGVTGVPMPAIRLVRVPICVIGVVMPLIRAVVVPVREFAVTSLRPRRPRCTNRPRLLHRHALASLAPTAPLI
jgi:hypothetical protein